MKKSNLSIVVMGTKGGVGKTTLSTQISLYFDTLLIDLCPYGGGVLEQMYGERVYTLELGKELPDVEGGDVVYDFGGYEDDRIPEACANANLIIIPFAPTVNNLYATLSAYNIAKRAEKPILFVVNRTYSDNDAQQGIDYLRENIEDELNFFILPDTRAVQTAENEGVSIIELANGKGLAKHTYKKIAKRMQELMDLIEEFRD